MATQTFSPAGGMNQDDSIVGITPNTGGRNIFELGDYKYAANTIIGSSMSDNFGDVENIKGTTEITDYYVRTAGAWVAGTRPSGSERVVGKYTNNEQRRLYYAVYNASGNHCIRYYDQVTNSVYELLKWSGLAFTTTMHVKMAMLDNWLALTDRVNAPRLVDVSTITDLYNTLTSNFREFHISFVKWAPLMPPILRKYYDGSTNNYDKFKNKAIQFKFRYVYKGKLKSRWSPASVSAENFTATTPRPITAIELYLPGYFLDQPGANVQYNYFGHDNIKFTAAVESIEIAYRESQLDLWRTFKTHTVASSGNTVFRFTGNSTGIPVATDDINQIFDTVPFLAGTVEAIDNRFMFGDCLNEQDPAMTPVITNVGYVKWDSNANIATWWNYGDTDLANPFSSLTSAQYLELGKRNSVSDLTFKVRGQYKPAIVFQRHDGWTSAGYTSDNWFYEVPTDTPSVQGEEVALTFKLDPSFVPPSWAVAFQIVVSNCLNIDYFMSGVPNSFQGIIDNVTQANDATSVPEDIKSRIREHFENARLVTGTDYSKYSETLKLKPFTNSIKQYVRSTVNAATTADASRIYIDINNWINSSKKNDSGTQNNPLNKLYYNFREGDRVRFTASTVTNPNAAQKTRYDVPILEFTGRGIIIEKPAGVVWLPGQPQSEGGTSQFRDPIIEVYSPRIPNTEDFLYYERGEWYPILYPGHASRDFAKRDWTYTNNAAVTAVSYGDFMVFNKFPLNKGDCHFFVKDNYRNISGGFNTIPVGTCSMNQNQEETFGEWERGNGRPNIGYTIYPSRTFLETQVRFGGQVTEQSFINNINRFRDEDQKIYPSEYGRIRDLVATANAQVESVGSILLAIGELETFSIYVNRTTLEDLSGRSQVTLSDKILGSYNTLLGSHGTLNPESVSVERGRVTFWDAINGAWVRYGRDGLTAISDYKMRTWFYELSDLLMSKYGTAEEPRVISEFHPFTERLYTYISHSTLPATFRDYTIYKGSTFSEDDKRWKECHGYTPEMFGRLNKRFFSFRNGSIYRHDVSSTYSTFYGTKQDVYIEPVFNLEQKDVKSWQNVTEIATHKWSVERFLSEYRGAKTKQQSDLTIAQFNEKEDRYVSAMPMDANTPNVTSPKISGDKMRSKAIRALMKLDPAVVTLSLLHYVDLEAIDSPKNT